MNDSSHPRLVSSNGQEFIVTDKMLIGRQPECQIHIQDGLASRRHAMLEIIDQKVVITDMGSNNGTWVNEQKISRPVELRNGDRVRIGETHFTLQIPSVQTQKNVQYREEESATNRTMAWQTSTLMALVRANDSAEFGLNRNTRIGRDESNDLPLKADASASQFHALIELVEGQAILSDLNSNNGTWVNGKRIAGKTLLRHGDKIRVGNTILRLRIGDHPLPPLDPTGVAPRSKTKTSWATWVAVILAGAALVITCVLTVPALYLFSSRESAPTAQASSAGSAPVSADTSQAKQQALRSLAYIVVPDEEIETNDMVHTGSGSFITSDGYILTNFHVIGYAANYDPIPGMEIGDLQNSLHNGEELIFAGINWANPVEKPDTYYRCDIVKTDPYLDLALLRVVESFNLETGEYFPLPSDLNFPVIAIGNSDDLKILEPITIIGFPGVGGDTPTAIDDQVAGFSPDENNKVKNGWIKTGPVISHGNSGGIAINQRGELIGIPTMVITNETDKIGYVRPVNLALSMIQEFLR